MSRGTVSGNGIVTDNLVLCLDTANPRSYVSGSTIWYDISKGGNNGTLTNGPAYTGSNGGAIIFDGTNDYVEINNPPITAGNYTFSAWIKTSFSGGYQQIASSWTGGGNGVHFAAITPGQKLYGYAGLEVSTNSKNLCDNIWHNVIVSRTGSSADFYVDGAFVQTSAIGSNNASLGDAKIGLRGDSTGQYFNGQISSVLIYNKYLSAIEISQNYNAQKSRFGL